MENPMEKIVSVKVGACMYICIYIYIYNCICVFSVMSQSVFLALTVCLNVNVYHSI